jgi:hypothetical protein
MASLGRTDWPVCPYALNVQAIDNTAGDISMAKPSQWLFAGSTT